MTIKKESVPLFVFESKQVCIILFNLDFNLSPRDPNMSVIFVLCAWRESVKFIFLHIVILWRQSPLTWISVCHKGITVLYSCSFKGNPKQRCKLIRKCRK